MIVAGRSYSRRGWIVWSVRGGPIRSAAIIVENTGKDGVLRLIAIEAIAQVDALAHFFWQPRVEISLDRFICCRAGRTMVVEQGQEAGVCRLASVRRRSHPRSPR